LSEKMNFDLSNKKYIVLLKHPLSSEKDESGINMRKTLKAINNFCYKYNYKVVGIYPNTDPGSYDILDAINEYKKTSHFQFYKNLPHIEFVNLMRNASALIGNSSMGILEAPFYKLPVVNVGKRQTGRLNAGNVEFVNFQEEDIIRALKKACLNKNYKNFIKNIKNPYGTGTAANKIANVVEKIDFSNRKWYIKKGLA